MQIVQTSGMKKYAFKAGWLLCIVVIFPLLYYACLKPWGWGLMDEPSFVLDAQAIRAAPGAAEKLHRIVPQIMPGGSGRYRPLYWVVLKLRFLAISSATGQHALQALTLLLIMLLWVVIARKSGLEEEAIPWGILFTLYFGPLTIATINFLSVQEAPGLLLISGAMGAALKSRTPRGAFWLLTACLLTLAAILLKETFFCFIPCVLWCFKERPWTSGEKVSAAFLALVMVGWPLLAILHVKGGYTSGYALDVRTVTTNTFMGIKNLFWTYKFAAPFLVVGVLLRLITRRWDRFDTLCALGGAAYFLVLVPWTSEMSYYQGPFAPFIGFLAARGAWTIAEALSQTKLIGPVWAALGISGLLCVASVTKQLRHIYKHNAGVQEVRRYMIDHWRNETVYVTGEEAARTLPEGMMIMSGRTFPLFVSAGPTTEIKKPSILIVNTGQTRYLPPAIPPSATPVLSTEGWQIFAL